MIHRGAVPARTGKASFGILSTYPPTRCGLAAFSAALSDGLVAAGADVSVVQVASTEGAEPSPSTRVVGQLTLGSATSVQACSELLNAHDVAIIQHAAGIYGDGDEVVDVIAGLSVPSIVILHTIPKVPSPQQRSVLQAIGATADQVVVMSTAASERLRGEYDFDSRKVSTIPHGVTVRAKGSPSARMGRPTILTWGLLAPGKGIERVIDIMGSLRDLPGRPRYVIAGRTHPRVLAAEGEAYREALMARAERNGVADLVVFDPNYYGASSLTALVQSAAVIVLPYDADDYITSGVLVDAIANGRPVVATAFPHAVELLEGGAGIVVDHDDPDALAAALRRLLTQPGIAGGMAAEARSLAPTMAWPVVAKAYLGLANRLRAARPALV